MSFSGSSNYRFAVSEYQTEILGFRNTAPAYSRKWVAAYKKAICREQPAQIATGFKVPAREALKSRDHLQSNAAEMKYCFLHPWEPQSKRIRLHAYKKPFKFPSCVQVREDGRLRA